MKKLFCGTECTCNAPCPDEPGCCPWFTVACKEGGGHEYAEKVCPLCGHTFCYSCCRDTNVHEGGKHEDDFMICPVCGTDYYA